RNTPPRYHAVFDLEIKRAKQSATNTCSALTTTLIEKEMAVVQSICSVETCERPKRRLGLCGAHYQRLKAHGDVRADVPIESRVRVRRSESCAVANCERPIRSGKYHMCDAHYKRVWRYGDPQADLPLAEERAESTPVVDFEDGTRVCQGCDLRLSLDRFHADKRSPRGRRKECKTC